MKLRLLLLLPLMLLTSCNDKAMSVACGPNFNLVCSHSYINYLRDTDTDIMYLFWTSGGSGNRAGWTVYYNKNGQPMTYAEFQEVHTARYH